MTSIPGQLKVLKTAGVGAVVMGLSWWSSSASARQGLTPNIVYILCDDLGYGDVQCLNPERGRIKTPNIDRLAKQGIVFTDAHGGSSVCTPTRYGILTGRYCWRSRLQQGVLDGGDEPPLIAEGRVTVASFLRQQGYHTAALGKWHLGFQSEGNRILNGPITRGFDTFMGYSNARTLSSWIEQDRRVENVQPVDMLPQLVERASRYIHGQAKSGRPFFLYLALNSPHSPIVPGKEWVGQSGLGTYGDFVMETDWAVGRVMEVVEKTGIEDDTLLIFTSDNGCSPVANIGILEKQGHFPSGNMRGYKSDIWDGGHRIPFIARWPGRIKPGTQSPQLICLTDLMATCAEIVGARLPDTAGEDSVSILPALLGVDTGPLREAVVYHSINGKFAVRQGPWKLELCPGSGGWGSPRDSHAAKSGLPAIQLYDMVADSGEVKNCQAENSQVVTNLVALLEKYVARGRSTPGQPQRNDVRIDIRKSLNNAVVKPD